MNSPLPLGIANRHALFLGLHLPTLETGGDMTESNDLKEARSIAWLGTWYLQKYRISSYFGRNAN